MNVLKHLLRSGCVLTLLSLMTLMSFPTTNALAGGGIRIRCDQEGAKAYVDGKLKGGCTPKIDVMVPAGTHKVVVRTTVDKDGAFKFFEKSIEVGDGAAGEVDAETLETKYTEEGFWKKCKSNGADGLNEYLKDYPKGKHVSEAKTLILSLETEAKRRQVEQEAEARRQQEQRETEARNKQNAERQARLDFFGRWAVDANIAGKQMNWTDANDYVASLNSQQYGGHSDWRLPTKDEFRTLMSYKKSGEVVSFLTGQGFNKVQGGWYYWTSSRYTSSSSGSNYAYAFWVDPNDVTPIHISKSRAYVWPIRSGQ